MALETNFNTESGQLEGRSATSGYSFSEKAFFRLTDQSEVPDFWEIIVTDISEQLRDGESRTLTVSDAFISFSTGALPIQVAISGWLNCNKAQDHRIDFLSMYQSSFRGPVSAQNKRDLNALEVAFFYNTTQYDIQLTQCRILDSVSMPGHSKVTLQGVAYNYGSFYWANETDSQSDTSLLEYEDSWATG